MGFLNSKVGNVEEMVKGSEECFFGGRVGTVRLHCGAWKGVDSTWWGGWWRQHRPYLCHSVLSTLTTHPKTGCQMAQKNGLEAIGAMVCRHFGEDGYFVGFIISLSFSKDGSSLYRIKYSDGDIEDLDQEEYNYAHSLHLKREGRTPLEVEDFGSDPNHSDDSQSTHAYKPAKVLH